MVGYFGRKLFQKNIKKVEKKFGDLRKNL